MRLCLSLILLLTLMVIIPSCSQNKKSEVLPNIILILADDMGYGDASCYNPDSKIQTPNIDKLASEGIQFTDAHTPSSVCTPTRYGLLTGRYCWRTRVKSGVILGYDETPLIDEGRETLGSLMQKSGYKTACIGKWHVGMNWETKGDYVIQDDENKWANYSGVFKENEENIDFTKTASGGPNDRGFDYSFITLGCSTSDNPYCFIEDQKTVGIPSVMIADKYKGKPGVVTALMEPNWSMEEVDPIFTGKAIEFIDKHMEDSKNNPFFLYLALSSPHIPFLPPDFTKGKSDEGPRGDLVLVVDWCLGQIEQTLEKHSIKDQTLLIFTSDNGPKKGANGHMASGKFRGQKANIWEGGHRVPFIARWPGNTKAGTTTDETISLTDMLASFAKLTGQELNENAGEDSYDVMPIILDQEHEENGENIRVFHSVAGVFAIRKGNWKLIEGTTGSGKVSLNQDSLKNIGQLYDMEMDPYETTNLYEEKPEIVKELLLSLQEIKNK